jgi:hypothetical protein
MMITLGGDATGSVLTGQGGYGFDLSDGVYALTPSAPGIVFNPSSCFMTWVIGFDFSISGLR